MAQINLGAMLMGGVAGTTPRNGNATTKTGSTSQGVDIFSQTLSKAKNGSSEVGSSKVDDAKATRDKGQLDNQKKTSSKDKPVNDKEADKVKDDVRKSKEPLKDDKVARTNTGDEAVEEVNEKEVASPQDEVLALISQMLQMPVEEVQNLLDQLNLKIEDLTSPEGFGKFIGGVYGEGDVSNLLTQEVDVKQINELFKAITTLQDDKGVSDMNVKLASEDVDSVLSSSQIATSFAEQGEENKVQDQAMQMVNAPTSEENYIVSENVNSTSKRVDKAESQSDEMQQMMMQGEENQLTTSDIGMTVPIQNFTTTTFTRMYQNGAEMVTNTTVTTKMTGEILEQVDFKVLGQMKELNVQLSPKELGTMNIKIVETNGALVAEIKVDNEKTKDFIANEISVLKDSLSEQGLNVTEVKVDIRQDQSPQSQMEQERQKSSKRIQEIIGEQYGEEEIEEDIRPLVSDSEVDYIV